MPALTHYDILGVATTAGPSEIREAYRRLAREHHPDRSASALQRGGGDASMSAINEAYRVLSDAARRAVYDASLRELQRGPAAPPTGSAGQQHRVDQSPTVPSFPSHLGPARVPWRSLLFFGVIAVVGIVVLAQFTDPAALKGPDGIIEIGSCVQIEANGDAREVACTADASVDLVVEAFVPFDTRCPSRTVAHRDRQGMGIACVADDADPIG